MIGNFLPYGVLFLVSVISFFKKGPIENKVLALVFLLAGTIAIAAVEGFWWRLLTIFIAASIPSSASRNKMSFKRSGSPIQNLMCIALVAMMIGEWIVGELLDHQPVVLMTIASCFFAFIIFFNVDSK